MKNGSHKLQSIRFRAALTPQAAKTQDKSRQRQSSLNETICAKKDLEVHVTTGKTTVQCVTCDSRLHYMFSFLGQLEMIKMVRAMVS